MNEHSIVSFRDLIRGFTAFSPSNIVENPYVTIGAVSWFIVFCAATWAVYSPSIRDTTLERLALALVATCSLSRAFFIFGRGEVPIDGVLAPASIAFYVVVIFIKTKSNMRKHQDEGTERRCVGKKA